MFAKGVRLRRASRSLPGAVPRGPASHWGRASLTAHRGRFHPGLPSWAKESLCESCSSRPIRPSRSMVVPRVRGASSLVRSDPRRRARDSGARPMRRRARTSGRTPDKQTRRWPLRRSEQRFACYLRVCSSRVSCPRVVSSSWPSFPFQHRGQTNCSLATIRNCHYGRGDLPCALYSTPMNTISRMFARRARRRSGSNSLPATVASRPGQLRRPGPRITPRTFSDWSRPCGARQARICQRRSAQAVRRPLSHAVLPRAALWSSTACPTTRRLLSRSPGARRRGRLTSAQADQDKESPP